MDRQSVKDFMFGGISELSRNKTYYYHSSVSSDYSHWTEKGTEAMVNFMNIVAHQMYKAEEAELDRRAKDAVINSLKGNHDKRD
jgi:hypothetical protein